MADVLNLFEYAKEFPENALISSSIAIRGAKACF